MTQFIEQIFARIWNKVVTPKKTEFQGNGLDLGHYLSDGAVTSQHLFIAHGKRAEHLAILGKTGTGKSSLLRYLAAQDIRQNYGFVYFDLHGDTTPYLLRLIALEESRRGTDLSSRLIVIEPGDPAYSVGLNVLEPGSVQHSFVQIAEFAQVLKQRWGLDHFGARTEELLRNSLHVLSENHLTVVELAPLLTRSTFRTTCLARVQNSEVREYFEARFNPASDGMQGTLRDPILNKVSTFTADPHFRHILGQQRSTFSLLDAIDSGYWVILNLDKGRLGEQAATLGSLFLSKIKNALFARRKRKLFTLYCDEIQNLVAFDSGLDTLLSEARKFAISVCSANQFLDQYPPQMRSAILAVASHILFQLSSTDAEKMAAAFDGGKSLAEILKSLPQRHIVAKIGHNRWCRTVVPKIPDPKQEYQSLYMRCRERWARRRVEVEQEIRARNAQSGRATTEALHEWE